MSRALTRLHEELGALGLVALGLLAASMLFHLAAIRPLEDRLARLDRELRLVTQRAGPAYVKTANAQLRPSRIGEFYRFFENEEGKAVWLAKIHVIAAASGIELRTGEYRLVESTGRIERYQITLPVSGSYAQIWTFLESALAEIPMLSLDQVSLRRKSIGEPRAEADVSLSLHLLKR